MKKVDIVFSGYLSSGIGPVQTIKRIIKNHDFFYKNGYDVSAFTFDDLEVPVYTKLKRANKGIISALKKIAKKMALNSKTYSRFRINLMFKESRRILDYYKALNRKPDILVFHSLIDVYEYLKHYKMPGVKVSLFTHSDGMMFKMLLSYFPRLIRTSYEKDLADIAHFIMDNIDVKPCIAKIEEKNLLCNYPQLEGKTCLVENGIDDLTPEQLNELNVLKAKDYKPKYRLVSAGSINGRKGQGEIVEALGLLSKDKLRDIHVDFIGEGREKPKLEEKVELYGLQDNVSFVGYIPNVDVYKYLGKSNIYILISKLEGLPLSIIEALRGGLGVISTNVSGIPEIVDASNGVLIDPEVRQLADVLSKLENYDWKEMGINSRKKFEEHYNFTRMRNDYLKMLNKMYE